MAKEKRRETTETERAESARILAIYRDRKKKALQRGETLTMGRVAELAGINPNLVSQYLNGHRPIGKTALLKLSGVLNFSPEEIRPAEVRNSYPIIDAASVDAWLKGEIEVGPSTEQRETTTAAGVRSFWMRVTGDEMLATTGQSFCEGMVILVDPDREWVSGSLVIAILPGVKQALFRKLATLPEGPFIYPLNSSYPATILPQGGKVVGRVIKAILDGL